MKIRGHRLLLASFVFAQSVSAQKTELPVFRSSESITLSYNDFRRLNSENQELWIQALRDFSVSLEKMEKGERVRYMSVEVQPVRSFVWLKVQALFPKACSPLHWALSLSQAHAQEVDYSGSAADVEAMLGRAKADSESDVKRVKEAEAQLEKVSKELDAKKAAGENTQKQEAQLEQAKKAVARAKNLEIASRDSVEVLQKQLEGIREVVKSSGKAGQAQSPSPAPSSKVITPTSHAGVDAASQEGIRAREAAQRQQQQPPSPAQPSQAAANPPPAAAPPAPAQVKSDSQSVNPPAVGVVPPAGPQSTGASAGKAAGDQAVRTAQHTKEIQDRENKDENKSRNTCIYAGWIQQMPKSVDTKNRATRCPRVTKVSVGNPEVILSCENGSGTSAVSATAAGDVASQQDSQRKFKPKGLKVSQPDGESSAQQGPEFRKPAETTPPTQNSPPAKQQAATAPEPKNPKATVVCHPVVFGLLDAGKKQPLCVEPGPSVTQKCGELSKIKKTNVSEAVKMFPDEYSTVVARAEALCKSNEAGWKSHFQALGVDEKQINGSVADLGQTCTVLQARLGEVKASLGSSATSGGSR